MPVWLTFLLKILAILFGGGALVTAGAPVAGFSSATVGEGLQGGLMLSIPALLAGVFGFFPGVLGMIWPAAATTGVPVKLSDAINAITAFVKAPHDPVAQQNAIVRSLLAAWAIALAVLSSRLSAELIAKGQAKFQELMDWVGEAFSTVSPPELRVPLSLSPLALGSSPFAVAPPAGATGEMTVEELLRNN